MKSYVFRIVVEPDKMPDGTPAFHAFAPALRGCDTWGHTADEAIANAREAVELYVADLVEAGEPVPVDPGQGTIELETPGVLVNV